MFQRFQNSYPKDEGLSVGDAGALPEFLAQDINKLFRVYGGFSFQKGLYRIVRSGDVEVWNARVAAAFPAYGGKIVCFAFDWLGRVFATSSEVGGGCVLLFEPGTGEVLEIPCDIATFHNEELTQYGDAALALNFHREWISNGGSAPRYDQCVGYKKPLFLGGVDDLTNLEIWDIDVYWHLMAQLIKQTKGLPLGTPVKIT